MATSSETSSAVLLPTHTSIMTSQQPLVRFHRCRHHHFKRLTLTSFARARLAKISTKSAQFILFHNVLQQVKKVIRDIHDGSEPGVDLAFPTIKTMLDDEDEVKRCEHSWYLEKLKELGYKDILKEIERVKVKDVMVEEQTEEQKKKTVKEPYIYRYVTWEGGVETVRRWTHEEGKGWKYEEKIGPIINRLRKRKRTMEKEEDGIFPIYPGTKRKTPKRELRRGENEGDGIFPIYPGTKRETPKKDSRGSKRSLEKEEDGTFPIYPGTKRRTKRSSGANI